MKKSDAILISSVPNIIYLTGYSGFSETEREAFILITDSKKYIITDKRYSEAIKKETKGFEIIEDGAIYFLINIAEKFFNKNNIKTLEVEENNLTLSEYRHIKRFVKIIPSKFLDNRIIKSENEIENLKEACKIGDKAFKFILNKLKNGITEKQISEELTTYLKSQNADNSFKSIIAFGANSSIPHHETGNSKLKSNEIVLMDFGVKINNYCSDMTRTIFFGKAPEKFRRIYDTVLKAQQLAILAVKDGMKASEVDKTARNFIVRNNYPDIIHSLGHGIGLEVHEKPHISPNSKEILKNGMVFSIEPGIYIPKYGGVRIEDLVLLREGKAQLISHSKREIIEIND